MDRDRRHLQHTALAVWMPGAEEPGVRSQEGRPPGAVMLWQRTWMRKTTYRSEPFAASLAAFTAQRDGLLQTLRTLDADGWARGATFTGTARGRERTILSYVRRLVAHELEHCQQVEATLQRR